MDSVNRREAKSGKISFADPVVLHETTKSRVVMVPFFIPHTEHTELAVKVVTYKKSPPPMEWAVVEEKSVSLKESAARTLLKSLQTHLAVADAADDGSFLVVRVAEGTAELGKHDPASVARALTNVLAKREIIEHLADTELTDEFLNAFRGAIRLREMKNAVQKLRQHLDHGDTSESIYQNWCDAHTWAFGNAYVMRDEIRAISTGDKLDLLLPTVISGYRDIVELKRPDMSVIHFDDHHQNYYFAAEVSKAIGQCHRYLDVLHDVAASGLRDNPEIVAYHPRAILVIGRSNSWDHEKLRGLHGLNRRLHGITIMTYDQLLAQGERLISMLAESTIDEKDELVLDEFATAFDDDDVPF